MNMHGKLAPERKAKINYHKIQIEDNHYHVYRRIFTRPNINASNDKYLFLPRCFSMGISLGFFPLVVKPEPYWRLFALLDV